ncbi:restriction endonuclease subunit S [Campylobacter jejuni]|uniref:Restriction endonuclease subunit S n=5 Tax=Campylobacter jejuni TaxID=197 RepID=A0AAD2QWK9_CAMJU|nr:MULTISPECIES: restriction endonuclease subunit S [Campylobacter]EAJ6188889.1 restriction endonuclease subunit S [Campylobacter fetus]WPM70857.1 restriction endonuclease subunit S [Campylobacter sp. CFSAN122719]AOH51735.1 type I restriction/modification system, S subunit [Campylobacter jejuni subsp. jejuni]APA79182.1 Type I restriction-modification system, specificity subunit S [Campylobacter jejuni subsp. jejuni M129]ASE86409.1 restriction endonuclease subunit S [Campylobacter jejuni]
MKNFKESGIEWLGEIPEHWEVVKINKIVTFVNGYAFENFDFNPIFEIPVIRIGDMQKEKILYDNCLKTKEKEKLKQFLISNNDILIALSGATTGKIAFCDTDNKAYINQRVAIVRSKLKLVKYYFLTRGFSLLIELACNGSAQPNISTKEIGEFKIPLPPLKEQEQIANFLDEKCKKIANFIEKKEKLITLLKEQKQALINETITKGLDKNINFKDSGIEWLGEIPQHWRIVKLKYVAFTNIGLVYTPDDIIENPDEGYPVLRANNIQNGKIDYQDLIYIKSKQIGKKQIISSGDLLMCVRNGSENLLGKTAKIQDGYFSFGAFTAIIKSQFNDYFYWIFQTNMLRKSIASFSASNGIGQISQDDIKNFIISFPPLKEQEQIAQFLDSEISKIDKIIEKTKKQIKLIKEYKTTLINQAVCGRIDL